MDVLGCVRIGDAELKRTLHHELMTTAGERTGKSERTQLSNQLTALNCRRRLRQP